MIMKFGKKVYDYSKPEEFIMKASNAFQKANVRKVLDLGSGTGRNFGYLIEKGFETYGIDIDPNAIVQAKKIYPKSRNKLSVGDMKNIPFEDDFFDGLIANQVIYHTDRSGMKKTISEMYRVLKNRGIFFVTLQPRENQEWRLGKKIEEWTFVASSGPDKGAIHHFVDLSEIKELFGPENLVKVYRDKRNDWCVIGKVKKR